MATMTTPTSTSGTHALNGKVKGYPAPAQLATPTDLGEKAAQAITEAINPLIADALALHLKTKNFHWHLSGSHFRDYHLLFDEQAEQILESVDILAERVRKLGGTTIRSISHVSALRFFREVGEQQDL